MLDRTLMFIAAVALGMGMASPLSPALAQDKTITVFAAASLTESFNELGKSFETSHAGVTVQFSFAASNQLRTQMEHGAKADIFASANMKATDSAVKSARRLH